MIHLSSVSEAKEHKFETILTECPKKQSTLPTCSRDELTSYITEFDTCTYNTAGKGPHNGKISNCEPYFPFLIGQSIQIP